MVFCEGYVRVRMVITTSYCTKKTRVRIKVRLRLGGGLDRIMIDATPVKPLARVVKPTTKFLARLANLLTGYMSELIKVMAK